MYPNSPQAIGHLGTKLIVSLTAFRATSQRLSPFAARVRRHQPSTFSGASLVSTIERSNASSNRFSERRRLISATFLSSISASLSVDILLLLRTRVDYKNAAPN